MKPVPESKAAEQDMARVLPFRPPERPSRHSLAGPLPRETEDFRRRKRPLRHFRRHPVARYAKPLLSAVAIVGCPVAVLFWVLQSPVFGLQELDVETEGRVEAAWVHKALRPAYSWNLPRLSLDWVDDRLKENPWVKSADLHKDLPGRLVVRVTEKREVALLRDGQEYSYVDADGQVITSFEPREAGRVDLPLFTRSSPDVDLSRALELAREIEEVAPHWSASLSEIEILGEDDFRVWTAALPFPLLVRAGTLARKTGYLDKLLPQITRRYEGLDGVDLRFARRIILQPSVRSRSLAAVDVHERGSG